MPSNQINPSNYNIDSFDSGFLGPITDSNFRTFLFTHNLPVVNPIVGGILGGNSYADRGTEFNVSNSNANVVDVPNLVDVANTPSIYNNLTNPRQVNLTNNLQNVNPEIANTLGITTPQQAGLGSDSSTQMNLNTSITALPSPSDVAEIPSSLNNFSNLRQDGLDKNPSLVELMTWHPDYAYLFYSKNDTYNSSYGVPTALKLGFAGNTDSWVSDGGYTTTTHEIRDIGYFKLNNKYGPEDLVAYESQNTANPPGTLQPLSQTLISQNTGFIQYSTSVKGDFRDQILSRTLGVGVIPFSTIGSGINYKPDGVNISQLDSIARKRRGDELKQRIKLNFIGDTVGALNLDPISILSGGKLINRDYTITVPKNKIGKAAQFAANLAGFNLPTSTLPEGSFGWDIPSSAIIGGTDVDIFDDLLDRTGNAQKSLLYDALNLNVYGPTLQSSTQEPPTKLGKILNNVLGSGQPPATKNYLSTPSTGTDTTDTEKSGRKKTLIDKINDKVSQVLNNNKKEPPKPKQQADTWTPHEGGFGRNEYISADRTYKLDSDYLEFNGDIPDESSTEGSTIPFDETRQLGYGYERTTTDENFSWKIRDNNTFKRGLLKYTQDIVNNSEIGDAGGFIGYFDSAKSKTNNEHKTGSALPSERPKLPSKGNQVRNVTLTKDGKIEKGDLYCRSWTSTRKYSSSNNLIRKGGNWWRNADKEMVKDDYSLLTLNYDKNGSGMPKIAWDNGDTERFKKLNIDRSPSANVQAIRGLVIPYMFSIENLAWKDAPQLRNIPPCELGPNGGRIMWFPPYDISFSDSTSVNWDTTNFIGRGEPIYTYNHTERSGSLSWTIVVDHPEVLNQLKQDFIKGANTETDNVYHSFFAGCNIEDIKELFRDFIPEGSKVNYKKDETTFSSVQPTTPEDPPRKEILIYFENCVTDGDFGGFNYKSPDGVGRSPISDVIASGYEVTKSCIAANYAGTNICPGVPPLNKAILPKGDLGQEWEILWPINTDDNNVEVLSVIEDLKKLAVFLVTASGKNYGITIASNTSASGTGPFNETLSKNREENTKNLLLQLMKFAEGLVEPASITTSDGKKYYYPTEANLQSNPIRWPKPTIQSQIGGSRSSSGDGDPCGNLKESDANSKKSKESRYAKITLEVDKTLQQQLLIQINKDLNKKFDEDQKTKNQELEAAAIKAANFFINECDYFQKMEEEQPFVYSTFSEKIKYFHPAFHAITPEGFNSRLTFLQQCTRQGPQVLKDDLPQNMVFGRPPICVLRIGDFYHTKIVIDSMNFTFDPLQWDLNPEGIGVQPMLAKVDMGFKFIGGSSLGGPISQLQNAVSYNFFANTSMYNPVEKSLAKLMEDRRSMTSGTFGIYGSFKSPEQANEYFNALYSPITDIPEKESNVNGASSNANPTVQNPVAVGNTAAQALVVAQAAPVNTNVATNQQAAAPTPPSSSEVIIKLYEENVDKPTNNDLYGNPDYVEDLGGKPGIGSQLHVNIKKPNGKWDSYEIKDNRKNCCSNVNPGFNKSPIGSLGVKIISGNGTKITSDFTTDCINGNCNKPGNLEVNSKPYDVSTNRVGDFVKGQITAEMGRIKYYPTEMDYNNNVINSNSNQYWSGDGIFDIEITYNPGKNPDTGFQQEVLLRTTITLPKT